MTPADGGDQEVELKYAVDDPAALRTAIERLSLPGITAGPWSTIDLEDRYVDTRESALERAGFGARLRRSDGRTVVTVKSIGRTAAEDGDEPRSLHRRMEMEAPAGDRLDPTQWPASPARDLIERITEGRPLRTLFMIHQQRHERRSR